jgi:hypothetical protein
MIGPLMIAGAVISTPKLSAPIPANAVALPVQPVKPVSKPVTPRRTTVVRRVVRHKHKTTIVRTRAQATVSYPDNIGGWTSQASAALVGAGESGLSGADVTSIEIIAQHESSDNPGATQQVVDVNSETGDPAKGLMQTTTETFDEFELPGYGQILNPVDNIIAAVRYVRAEPKYDGSLEDVPGVVAVEHGQPYVGY